MESDSGRRGTVCDEPNRYARPAGLDFRDECAVFRGYQEFVLTGSAIQVAQGDTALERKRELLASYFSPRYLQHRTVLDLGAAAGFFSFWSLLSGADRAIAVDLDEAHLRLAAEASARLGFRGLQVVRANIADWEEPADVVFALALIHWVYSCTAVLGDLDTVAETLVRLTKYMVIVEWVDPDDPAIGFFRHLDWNQALQRGPYNRAAFEAALARHFVRWEVVGDVAVTRRLYAAFRTPFEVDLSGPLPLILPKETVISSRCLARRDGVEYWSRVYDGGEVIYKQATADLATREGAFLKTLSGAYFPRVLATRSEEDYAVVVLEKIRGQELTNAAEEIRASAQRFYAFIGHCLDLLDQLRRRGIVHRDIRAANVLVREGMPVLIDFGWAISRRMPYFTPEGLGASGRPADGSFCDVYSMGRVLEDLDAGRHPALGAVIALMTEREADLRLTDLSVLRLLFAVMLGSGGSE